MNKLIKNNNMAKLIKNIQIRKQIILWLQFNKLQLKIFHLFIKDYIIKIKYKNLQTINREIRCQIH